MNAAKHNGNVETRFKPGQSGNPGGRPSRNMYVKLMREARKDGGTAEEDVIRHMIEVATRWEVKTVGYDRELDQPIQVASGRDAVEAAKLLLHYLWGKPSEMRVTVAVPDGLVTEGRSMLDIAADIYRHRLISGQMPENEFHEMVNTLLSVDKVKTALLLKLLGANATGKSEEEIRAMLTGRPIQPQIENQQPTADSSHEGEKAPDNASPKGCDTASHAPGCENGSTLVEAVGEELQEAAFEPATVQQQTSCFHVSEDDEDE